MPFDRDVPTVDHHIRKFPLTAISQLSPYTGLIVSVVLVVFFLNLRCQIHWLGRSEPSQLQMVNHHIAGATKIIILIVVVYPFGDVAFGTAGFYTPFVNGSRVTMGDILAVSAQMLVGMFIFELIYRTKISPISAMEKDSGIEFLLCTVWVLRLTAYVGAFDIISKFLPHLTIILCRVYPDSTFSQHSSAQRASRLCSVPQPKQSFNVMYLFGQLWSRWTLSYKIATPVLHVAFSAAQFHGTRIFYQLWQKQKNIIQNQRDEEK
ncbi:hypothetical protein DFH06DRAFT_1291415 [Mycena polygramma]|nr:hypothetical protein DFH06DRAFT_1291415 [Mycena polygramma]